MSNCLVCDRIDQINNNNNPFFVAELKTGYVVLFDYQSYRGYSLFLSKIHACELHELKPSFKNKFMEEMSIVAKSVYEAFEPDKLNYELLGNKEPHIHWHLIPRRKIDKKQNTAIWAVSLKDRLYTPTPEELSNLKNKLLVSLSKNTRLLSR